MSTIPDMIVAEAKSLPDDLAKEVLDFILFLKVKKNSSSSDLPMDALSIMQEDEWVHLEKEFENYKLLYPNE